MSELTSASFIPESTYTLEPEISTGSNAITGLYIMYMIVGIIGFLDNLLVVVVIATSRSMRKRRTNWFLINQSVIDMLTAGVLAAQAYTPTIRITSLADVVYCKLWYNAHFLWAFAATSTYNLLMITLERYLAIVHPVWHKNHVTWKLTMVGLAFPWLLGNAWGMYDIPTSPIVDEECFPFTFPTLLGARAFGLATFIIQFPIPLLIMIVCYIRIFLVFTGRRQATGSDARVSKVENDRIKARENVLKTLVTVCVAFFLCWVSNQVYFLLFNIGIGLTMSNPFYPFSVATAQINCAINPLIYAAKYTEFRKAFVRLVRRGKVGTEGDGSTLSTAITATSTV